MRNKGISTTIGQIFASLFVIGLVALAVIILYQQFAEVHILVDEQGVRRHTIDIANVILSSSNTVYEVGDKKQRAVFDEYELDDQFLASTNADEITDVNDFLEKTQYLLSSDYDYFDKYSYPNTLYIIIVKDLEEDKWWFTMGSGSLNIADLNKVEFFECLGNNIFEGNLPSIHDVRECWSELKSDSSTAGAVTGLGVGASKVTFPVNIKTSADTHMGSIEIIAGEV